MPALASSFIRIGPRRLLAATSIVLSAQVAMAGEIHTLWPDAPPGEDAAVSPSRERDITDADSELIGEARVMRLTDVATPTLDVYLPSPDKHAGSAVVICPGGGFHVLAYDLEGTEVAEWFNSLGVACGVLKYRVPTAAEKPRWRPPVQDTQRALSYLRANAQEWGLDADRIGVCGFSAGGNTASFAALLGNERLYEPIDPIDEHPCHSNFGVIVYTGGYIDRSSGKRAADIPETSPATPPMFLVHATDDRLSSQNSVTLYSLLERNKIPAELHIFADGGHGYGLRDTGASVNAWPSVCRDWLDRRGLLAKTRRE